MPLQSRESFIPLMEKQVLCSLTRLLWYNLSMAAKLSPEQREAIKQHPGTPVYVVDVETQATYVLLPADTYQQVRTLLGEEPFDIRETYPAQDAALSKVWDDPELDVYQDYDSHERPS